MSAARDVAALVARRDEYTTARGRIWPLPGEPLVGIVTAADREMWSRLGALIAHLDREVDSIRATVAPRANRAKPLGRSRVDSPAGQGLKGQV